MNIHDSVVQENIKLETHDNNGREKRGKGGGGCADFAPFSRKGASVCYGGGRRTREIYGWGWDGARWMRGWSWIKWSGRMFGGECSKCPMAPKSKNIAYCCQISSALRQCHQKLNICRNFFTCYHCLSPSRYMPNKQPFRAADLKVNE